VHVHLPAVLYLLEGVNGCDEAVLLVQLQHETAHEDELLNADGTELFGREELPKEALEVIQLGELPNALLASDELVDPLVVLPALGLLLLQLVPDPPQSSHVDLHLVAQLVDEAQQTQQLADDTAPVGTVSVVADGSDDHLVDVLLR
jgi:hypothetical protein